jgi:hypothetical protein
LLPRATAREIGPTLPKYIVTIIMSFPNISRLEVRFRESPTVADALTVSYITSRAGAPLLDIKSTVEVAQIKMNVTETATAFFMDASEMHRPNRVAWLLFLTVA